MGDLLCLASFTCMMFCIPSLAAGMSSSFLCGKIEGEGRLPSCGHPMLHPLTAMAVHVGSTL